MNSKSAVCMSKNFNDIKHIRHISRRVNVLRNGEKFNMYNIDLCEVGMKLADIATQNVSENYLNPRMKYIMVRIDK